MIKIKVNIPKQKLGVKQHLENNYILNDISEKKLKELGFRRYNTMSTEETSYYIYKFPVYKYLGRATLECEIIIDSNTGEIRIDVYDMDHDVFPAFYNTQKYEQKLIEDIRRNILKEYKKLGLELKTGAQSPSSTK